MNRKDFLKGISLTGLGLSIPATGILKNNANAKELAQTEGGCVLIPSETAGPFPLDLTENSYYFRQDIRETQTGAPLNIKLKIIGLNNCEPMPNLRVNVWHCNKDGIYSGYNTNNNPGDTNAKHLRGYQFTNANGEVEFISIFPGWYNGRIAHVHFQVYVSTAYAAVSQFTFDIAAKNAIYLANPSLYSAIDPTSYTNDNVFSDGYTQQIATLTPNATTGGYDAYLEVSIQGTGTVGIGHIEKENDKVFELGQNFPNPYINSTNIPFTIKQASEVSLELWDLSGKKVANIFNEKKEVGNYTITINPEKLGLPIGNYIYQLEARNSKGIFRIPKMMTVAK